MLVVLFAICLAKFVGCLEESEPEIFLAPRNFNPHPYETGVEPRNENGPVVFPRNPSDDEQTNSVNQNIITIPRQESHPVDHHPYAKVAQKQRYKVLAGRYHNEESEPNPRVYLALAKHAGRVLSQPPQDLKNNHIPTTSTLHQRNYAFSYKVVDDRTGDDFSHSQSQNSKSTNGEYRVKLPDGRLQIVSYTADKDGYKAEVKYMENEVEPSNVEIQKVPVRELNQKLYDQSNYYNQAQNYVLYNPTASPAPAVYYSPTASPAPSVLYNPTASPAPSLYYHHEPQSQPKVQIITSNARDYSIGSYVPPTSAPYYVKTLTNYKRGGRPTVEPQVVNNGVHGLVSPSPTAFVLTDQHGNVLASTVSPVVIKNNGHHGHVIPATVTPYGDYGDYILTTVAPPAAQDYDYDVVKKPHQQYRYNKK